MARDVDRSHLHPRLRSKLIALDSGLAAKGIPLRLYEGARSPFRQAELYSMGRGTGERGKTVTRARAWESRHQYGLAVDYVFYVNGAWTWAEPHSGMWATYQQLADALDLRPLSFEKPHVETQGALSSLQAGVYPPSGDQSWMDWIDTQIELWGREARTVGGVMHPAAPPLAIERPAEVA